ncbi:MAG: hypothetical protein ABSF45_09305 [Terriglobia bacterium]
MNTRISRRNILKTVGATVLLSPSPRGASLPVLRQEDPETPKICLEINGKVAAGNLDETGMRRVKQLGVNHVAMGGPEIPWEESQIRALVDRLKSGGPPWAT